MAYVIYHAASTMQMGPTPYGNPHSDYAKYYKTYGGALATMKKWNEKAVAKDAEEVAAGYTVGGNRTGGYGPGPYGVASVEHYKAKVVRTVEKTNLLSGGKYTEASNTPGYMSPSSEAYWQM